VSTRPRVDAINAVFPVLCRKPKEFIECIFYFFRSCIAIVLDDEPFEVFLRVEP
jgi:hypothetical protein